MTDQIFRLPDLGEGLTEAVILEWRVQVGDTVDVDQVVVEVETAKTTVELPTPYGGTVTALHGAPGTTLEVGTPLITVSGGQATPPADADHERYRTEEQAGSGNVLIGYGTSASAPARRRRRGETPHRSSEAPSGPVRVISPVVRSLARSRGIELSTVNGTGAGHVITRADVERASAQESTLERDTVEAITGFRKAVADKMSTSRREIPDATTWVDVDATGLLEARRHINAGWRDSETVSLMALLGRLAVAALRQYPVLNATVDSARNEIRRYTRIHLGVAAQTPRGLMVPVIRDADTMNTVQLTQALTATTTLARSGKLPPERLSGGTFTLNNYGVFGVDGSTPIINHPEAAILGIGRIVDKPWVCDGSLAVRKITQISLTFDHRVCDGADAGGFLRLFADYVENPVTALGRI